MKNRWACPKTLLGRLAVRLNVVFLAVILVAVVLVKVFRVLSFDQQWWDITVLIFLAPIVALVLGILAIRRKDPSMFLRITLGVSTLAILFLLLHSLFIAD